MIVPCTAALALAIAQPEEPLLYHDMTPLFELDLADEAERREFWDVTHLVAALQGCPQRDNTWQKFHAGHRSDNAVSVAID